MDFETWKRKKSYMGATGVVVEVVGEALQDWIEMPFLIWQKLEIIWIAWNSNCMDKINQIETNTNLNDKNNKLQWPKITFRV